MALLTFLRPSKTIKKLLVGLKLRETPPFSTYGKGAANDNAILYILRLRIVRQTHLARPVQIIMRTLFYLQVLLHHHFSQACPGVKVSTQCTRDASSWLLLCYKHQAGSCSAIHIKLAQYSASGINMASLSS